MKTDFVKKTLEISENPDIDIASRQAIRLQNELAGFIRLDGIEISSVETVAGADIAYNNNFAVCSIVVMDFSLEVVETVYSIKPVTFPYKTGLLAFREIPVFLSAYGKLKSSPDLFIFDGQGIAHPRLLGIATHCGILIDKPTVGCAKSSLYPRDFIIPPNSRFSASKLRINNRSELKDTDGLIGYVLRSKENVKPIYISTGFMISPENALEVIKRFITSYKLPMPTHLADKYSKEYKRGMK
jgi:deoxyribonuclease V